MRGLKDLFIFNSRLLFFRFKESEFNSFHLNHLIFGIFLTWIVGMGRWWDDPKANIYQHLGLGSLGYIFILSFIIWLLVLPLKPRAWSYVHVLTFVSLTSLPALLYAIPVELYFSLEASIRINTWFLAVVALWRVALYFFYLTRHAGLSGFYTFIVGLLPLSVIVTSLFAMNLHQVVFDIMGGFREKTVHDGEYGILFFLTALSYLAIIPLLLCYIGIIVHARKKRF